jgi:predicted dehydrogenase
MLFDWGPHLIDQALKMVASPLQSVYGDLQSRVWSSEVDDHFSCTLRFAGGAVVRLEASNDVRLPVPRWLLVGTKGTACSASPGRGAAGVLRIQAGDLGGAETVRPYPAGSEVCLPFYENWYRAMAEGAPLAVPAEETLAVLRVLDMVRASAEADQVVRA